MTRESATSSSTPATAVSGQPHLRAVGGAAAAAEHRSLYPLGDFAAMVELLAHSLGVTSAEAEYKLRYEFERLGNNVRSEFQARRLKPFEWGEELAAFYAQSQAFVYELLTWNSLPMKDVMRGWVLDYLQNQGRHAQRIVCVGDGLGFDSAALALAGHRVVYFEVGAASRAFAGEVFARNAAPVEKSTSLAELERGTFDVVVCLDVLEHVPEPSALVATLTALLKPGGLMFVCAPFWLLDAETPTHLRQHLRYAGDWRKLYAPHGLRLRAGRWLWDPFVLELPVDAGSPLPWKPRILPTLGGMFMRAQRPFSWPFKRLARSVMQAEVRKRRGELLGR